MKNKKMLIIIIFTILLLLIIFFIKNNYKISKHGNNISNKSADEIKEYILNIESYQANATIIIKSNKNENTYKVKQQYSKENNVYKQEVIEPDNIKGVQFIYDGNILKIENTKLGLSKLYENYNFINSNELSIISFIEDYKANMNSQIKEEDGRIILEAKVKSENKYVSGKKLYINKAEGKIEKLEIQDITQNTKIYILYNEIEINTEPKEETIAFSINELEENI